MAKNQHEFNEKSETEICVDDEPTHSSMEQKTCAESFQKDFSAIDNLLRMLQKGKIAKHKLDEEIIHTRISVCHRIDEFLKVTWWSQNISKEEIPPERLICCIKYI